MQSSRPEQLRLYAQKLIWEDSNETRTIRFTSIYLCTLFTTIGERSRPNFIDHRPTIHFCWENLPEENSTIFLVLTMIDGGTILFWFHHLRLHYKNKENEKATDHSETSTDGCKAIIIGHMVAISDHRRWSLHDPEFNINNYYYNIWVVDAPDQSSHYYQSSYNS